MRSSEDVGRPARRVALALTVGLGLVACAQHDPQRLALRDRIEQGALTPEDSERFFTPDRERQAVVAAARDDAPRLASAADLALARAVVQGETERVRQLIKDGAQVNAVDETGRTPLLHAAREGDLETARLLLRAGADPDGRAGPMTPLGQAALRGHTHLVRLLLRAGARVDAVGLNGQTPLMNAVQLNRLEAAELLLKAGARTQVNNRAGEGLLLVAINNDLLPMVDLLLRHGLDPDMPDADGLTPLYWATQFKREAMVQRLLAAGAQPDRQRQVLRASRPYPKEDL